MRTHCTRFSQAQRWLLRCNFHRWIDSHLWELHPLRMLLLHASCIALNGRGVLFRGCSGAGKSDLALRLIDRGGVLVSDDQVEVSDSPEGPVASPPKNIAGKIEVRGLGIVSMSYRGRCPLFLVVDLVDHEDIERLPKETTTDLMGYKIRWLVLHAFDGSAPIKVQMALAEIRVTRDIDPRLGNS